jgi:dipeptidase E
MSSSRLLLVSLGLGALPDFVGLPGARIGFVPTAGHPYPDPSFVREDRARIIELGFSVTDIDFAAVSAQELRGKLEQVDVLFVAGGNTFYLLQEVQRNDLAPVLVEFVKEGLPYVGASAGAVLAGPSVVPVTKIDDPSEAPLLNGFEGLGLTQTVVLPHFGKEKYLPLYDAILLEYATAFRLQPLRDSEALILLGDEEPRVIPSELILQ